eukprot:759177-Rhodomonas_salina.1
METFIAEWQRAASPARPQLKRSATSAHSRTNNSQHSKETASFCRRCHPADGKLKEVSSCLSSATNENPQNIRKSSLNGPLSSQDVRSGGQHATDISGPEGTIDAAPFGFWSSVPHSDKEILHCLPVRDEGGEDVERGLRTHEEVAQEGKGRRDAEGKEDIEQAGDTWNAYAMCSEYSGEDDKNEREEGKGVRGEGGEGGGGNTSTQQSESAFCNTFMAISDAYSTLGWSLGGAQTARGTC